MVLRPALVSVILAAAAPAGAQVLSPGELGASHRDLEGISNCTRCHVLGQKIDGKLCLECHEPLAREIQKARGFHGRGAAANRPCLECHKDHRGRSGALAEWSGAKEKFSHQGTGFALTGAHLRAPCDRCHRAERVEDEELAKILRRRPEGTYLGLSPRCLSCHEDPHRTELGSDCQRCHGTEKFKPASGFDHTAVFPLKGAHARAECALCHRSTPGAAGEKAVVHYRGAGRTCVACHQDVHGGKFGSRCERCHGQESWTRTRLDRTDIAFHERTRFKLVGRHRAAACETCHPPKKGGGLVTRGVPFGACQDCHLDAHFGQMALDPAGRVPCQRCHDEQGFFPSRFPLADHQKGRYPLEGAHRLVPCNACHRPDPEGFADQIPSEARNLPEPLPGNRLLNFTRIRMPRLELGTCESCHRDPHGGQFSGGKTPKACADCHAVSDFETVRLDHDRDTAYPLTGAHGRAPCAGCHRLPSGPEAVTLYRGTPTACADCHRDAHRGQFAKAPCEGCHQTAAFAPSRFSHDDPGREIFRLEGRHREVPCARCHPSRAEEGDKPVVWFRGIPSRCDGCHFNVHAAPTPGGGR